MSENTPKLQVYRPVLNIEKGHHSAIGELLQAAKISKFVRVTQRGDLNIKVLAAGELAHFHEEMGIVPTAELLDDLAGLLEDNMPESCDDTIIIPTFPFGIESVPRRPQKELYVIGACNPVADAENKAAQHLINEFSQTPDGPVADEGAWLDYSYLRKVWLAHTNNPTAKEVFRRLMATEIELPPYIELGPVEIRID